jgi:hypothetical protein
MGADPLERIFGLSPGALPWTLAWVAIALALLALGGLFLWLIGRVHKGMILEAPPAVEEAFEEETAPVEGLRFRGHVLIPQARMQDDFANAGIELLSPVYEAARDGSASTIPSTG